MRSSGFNLIGRNRRAFSLVELLVVIGIIGLLIAILLPSLAKARRSAVIIQCAANLHQIATAFQMYLGDSQGTVFWRGPSINDDGMEWYTWGGRSSGNPNHWQTDIFNRIDPRPLNKYVGNQLKVFQCPADTEISFWTDGVSHCEWVGNSYNFNAVGDPQVGGNPEKGMVGKKFSTAVRDSSHTILFLDAGLVYPGDWHGGYKGNICFCDTHVAFTPRPCSISTWDSASGSLYFSSQATPSQDYTWGD